MYKPIRWIAGTCKVRLNGAEPQQCLNRLSAARVQFWDPFLVDEFSYTVTVYASKLGLIQNLAELSQCSLSIEKQSGFLFQFGGLRRRIPFLCMLLLTIFLCILLHNRVWYFSVEGNTHVPDQKILRAVASCDVGVGTKGKDIVPQQVKDHVLAMIPELSWLTVRQNGCRAIVVVREKQFPTEQVNRKELYDIVAARPGIVDEISVLDGSAVCALGDLVDSGDKLISAYVDLEYKLRAAGARGEVYARTWHTELTKIPLDFAKKIYRDQEKTISYLCFGKKRIKLSRSSGIPALTCDKITQTKPLTLPGGFQLPVTLVRETYRHFDPAFLQMEEEQALVFLKAFAARQVTASMIAGQILSSDDSVICDGKTLTLRAEFACREMIGRKVNAEIFKED